MQQRSCRRRVCCDYRAPLDSLFVCGVDIAVCAAPLACQGMPCRQRHWHTLSLTLLFASLLRSPIQGSAPCALSTAPVCSAMSRNCKRGARASQWTRKLASRARASRLALVTPYERHAGDAQHSLGRAAGVARIALVMPRAPCRRCPCRALTAGSGGSKSARSWWLHG